MTISENEEIRQLRKENKHLRESNEILKAASIFFAGELDPPKPLIIGFIEQMISGDYAVKSICRFLPEAGRGDRGADLPARQATGPSARAVSDAQLLDTLDGLKSSPESLYGRRKWLSTCAEWATTWRNAPSTG